MTAAAPRLSAATPARAWLKALETTAQATRGPARTLARAAGDWAAAGREHDQAGEEQTAKKRVIVHRIFSAKWVK